MPLSSACVNPEDCNLNVSLSMPLIIWKFYVVNYLGSLEVLVSLYLIAPPFRHLGTER